MAAKRKSSAGSSAVSSFKSSPRPATQDPKRNATTPAPAQAHAPAPRRTEANSVSEVKQQPKHEDIARAAYLRWLRDGGDPATNWLAAEAELKGRAALKL